MSTPTSDLKDFPPSYFAERGQPCGSRWGKSELEWLALAYVQALAKDGDEWKRISREQVFSLLSDEQKTYVYGMLTLSNGIYESWFKSVSNQLASADGAFDVSGFWRRREV